MNIHTKIKTVREILLHEWDPLNVGDNPNLADEYDSCVGTIIQLIDRKSDSKEIKQHLLQIEKELGVHIPDDQRMKAVSALLALSRFGGQQ